MARRIFITVAEVSGDQHAAQLVRSIRALDPSIEIEGLGGPRMREAGANILYETTRAAAMGVGGIGRVVEMLRVFRWLKATYFIRRPADLQICVDSPAMNFHYARAAKEQGIPVLYYIAPQLWAWREGRMKKLRKWVDAVACILPFEQEYFRRHGVNATFVGHPLFDELPKDRVVDPALKYPNRPAIVGLLPGSRTQEAKLNFPHLLDVARRLALAIPDISFRVPTLPATDSIVNQILAEHPLLGVDGRRLVKVCLEQFDQVVPQCDLCLTVSGTATLHVAAYGVPMIVVYRGSRIFWNVVARHLVKTRTFSLVNLLAAERRHIVPEFIPWFGSDGPVFAAALEMLKSPEKLADQRGELQKLVRSLDQAGASNNTARMAIELMGRKAKPGEAGTT